MTTTTTPCTDEQQAEWSALHDRMAELADKYHRAQREAGAWLTWALEHGEDLAYAQEQAVAEARRAAQ